MPTAENSQKPQSSGAALAVEVFQAFLGIAGNTRLVTVGQAKLEQPVRKLLPLSQAYAVPFRMPFILHEPVEQSLLTCPVDSVIAIEKAFLSFGEDMSLILFANLL